MKKQNGITLIALVITIIVLLILAGVSISAITGENGIVDKAKEAAGKTEEAEKEEQDALKGYEDWIDSSLEDSNTIKFTIADVEYSAEKGMTWGEWIESEYNVDGYTTPDRGGETLVDSTKEYWVTEDNMGNNHQFLDDEIKADFIYYYWRYGESPLAPRT